MNLYSQQGGALFLSASSSDSMFELSNNIFSKNNAQQGGAIYIQNARSLISQNNTFFQNNKDKSSSTQVGNKQKVQGGAIYYNCENEDQNCEVSLQQDNFTENYADDGGAILWTTKNYSGKNIIFQNNSAFYGKDVASYPRFVNIFILANNDYAFPYQSKASRLLDSENLIQFVSGIPVQLKITIYDQDGLIYRTDNISRCSIIPISKDVTIKNNQAIAQDGIYNFNDLTIITKQGYEELFYLEFNKDFQTFGNNLTFLQEDSLYNFTLPFRTCISGEEYTSDFRCVKCIGTYLYNAPVDVTPCKVCPEQALCFNGSKVGPKGRYWRSSNISENFIQCPNQDACLVSDINNPIGICLEGYHGKICGKCDTQFSSVREFYCSKCPDQTKNWVIIIFSIVVISVIILLLVRSTLQSSGNQKPQHCIYMKIMTNHLQLLGAILGIDYKWPSVIQNLQDSQQTMSSVTQQLLSFDCLLANAGYDESNNISLNYIRLIIYAILPIIMAILTSLFWYIAFKVKTDKKLILNKYFATQVIILFLIHPDISKIMFQTFNCIQIDDEYRLRVNVDNVCYEGQHLLFLLTVVIPSIVIWTIGIPLGAFVLMYRVKDYIQKRDNLGNMDQNERIQMQKINMQYGFLFNGYKPQYYFWEILIISRKIIIVISAVFLSRYSQEVQILIAMFFIGVSIILQIKVQPFTSDNLNRMEYYSLIVQVTTLYCGMFYTTGRYYDYMDKPGLQWFFLLFLILPNAIFFLFWLRAMRFEILKILKQKKKPTLFKLCACFSIDYHTFQANPAFEQNLQESNIITDVQKVEGRYIQNRKKLSSKMLFESVKSSMSSKLDKKRKQKQVNSVTNNDSPGQHDKITPDSKRKLIEAIMDTENIDNDQANNEKLKEKPIDKSKRKKVHKSSRSMKINQNGDNDVQKLKSNKKKRSRKERSHNKKLIKEEEKLIIPLNGADSSLVGQKLNKVKQVNNLSFLSNDYSIDQDIKHLSVKKK